MFYKNKEHYENTLKMVIREELGVEVKFISEKVNDLIFMFWVTSDRNCKMGLTVGYDLLCWARYRCEDYSEFEEKFSKIIDQTTYGVMDTDIEFNAHIETLFSELGITPERDEF